MSTSRHECVNCHRQGGSDITFSQCISSEVRKKWRKKYFTGIQSDGDLGMVTLCINCKNYLFDRTNDPIDYWPSMVYVFLNYNYPEGILEVPFRDRWRLIPAKWKQWWADHFSHQIIDGDTESVFKDVTEEMNKLNEAVNDLKWLPLARCMDAHFAYPEVRCPFGCSEFLHAANTVPFEDFLWAYSNYQISCYRTNATRKTWVDNISPSYPSMCLILEKFECSPCVALTDDGMMVLSCREHSKYTTESYLHIPESPIRTGTIYSPHGNAFAPVVIRSRTTRHFKGNQYSDTFCTVKQMGGYAGIDSAYVTTSNTGSKQDNMALLRDCLSIQGRPDIKAQIEDRVCQKRSPTFMPKISIESIIGFSEAQFPNPSDLPQWKTSTYISCETAVTLQEKMYGESSMMLNVYTRQGDQEICAPMLYIPPWPTYFVNIQTMDDYGRRFHPVRECSDGMWMFLCMTGTVTDVWEAIAGAVEDNKSWHGHWLRYATKVLGFKGMSQRSQYFPAIKEGSEIDQVYEVFDPPLEEAVFNSDDLAGLFDNCSDVLVVEGDLPSAGQLRNEFTDKHIIICLNPRTHVATHDHDGLLELRCLLCLPDSNDDNSTCDSASTDSTFIYDSAMDGDSSASSSSNSTEEYGAGSDHVSSGSDDDTYDSVSSDDHSTRLACKMMYVRHPGKKFWVQEGNNCPSRCANDGPNEIAWRNSRIVVYCRVKEVDAIDLQRRYLSVLGGQTSIVCDRHRCPLIINHKTKRNDQRFHVCACRTDATLHPGEQCRDYAQYICPRYATCRTGICKSHFEQAKQHCAGCAPGTVMFLSPQNMEYNNYRVDDGGLIGNVSEDIQMNVPPEVLGPTAPYEIPQDAVDNIGGEDEVSVSENYDIDFDGSVLPGSENYHVITEHDGVEQDEDEASVRVGYLNDEDEVEEENLLNNHHDANGNDQLHHDEPDPFEMAGLLPSRTGTRQVDIELDQRDGFGCTIPLVTLFNEQGHLLTRTNDKIRMCRAHSAVCEKIVATNSSKVIPLVYAEAQLFPDIFYQSLDDGTIPGALPTAMWSDASTLKKLGVASMRKHAVNRITNPAILTSVHPAYHFMLMDLQVNIGLRGKDTRLVLHRGFADIQGNDGVRFREKSDAAELYGESSENHANVHKLSALCQEKTPHFFFTQSCNQETCKGLRVLREWVTSDEAVNKLTCKYGITADEASRFIRESAASYLLRSWNEVVDMWMRYIIHSSEAPIGEIEYAWYRKEFQDYVGNLSHIHAILRTIYDINTREGREMILSKIRGCVSDLIHTNEYLEMKSEGLISSVDHLIDLLNQAKAYLTHHCTERCQVLRTTKDGEHYFFCKVRDNVLRGLTPFQHTMKTMMVEHIPEAKVIYQRLGMMDGDKVLDDSLKAQQHIPVCSSHDPKFSPTNGRLFACFPSSQNLQLSSGYFICAYLTKYVAGLDDVAIIVFRPRDGYAKAIIEPMQNTKISSNKKRAEEKKKKVNNCARYLTQMEAITVILGAPLVTSSKRFVHIPTSPREYRTAFTKQSFANQGRVPDSAATLIALGQDVREELGFPPYRQFSERQMEVIEDEMHSNLTTCKITEFSVRPPELRFVNKVSLYFRWFERIPIVSKYDKIEDIRATLKYCLDEDPHQCEWIDGFNTKITLRRGAVCEILKYISRECKGIKLFGTIWFKGKMVSLFTMIKKLLEKFEWNQTRTSYNIRSRTRETSRRQYKELCGLFLSPEKSCDMPVIWTTPVYPRNKTRFLIHFLLRFGRFETEYELMDQTSLKNAYICAGLFDPATPESRRRTFDELMTFYVRGCLYLQPGSLLQRDRNLVLAQSTFSELLFEHAGMNTDEYPVQETPCVLQTHMRQETTEKIADFAKGLSESFVASLISDLQHAGFHSSELPNQTDIINKCFPRTQMPWSEERLAYTFPPPYNPHGRQSLDSYNEQRDVLLKAKNEIDRFKNGHSHSNLVICGGPGNGKTTTSNEICLYAFSQGLRGIATSIVADRSKVLGGMHIHLLCGLQGKITSPGRAADAAVRALYCKPELFQFWKQLQFVYIDEVGVVSAETLATIDIIVRKVKNSHQFMGGMLVIGTMDIYQLQPVDGTPVMMSMNMTTEFNFFELCESVRAANDENLRRICNLSRTIYWTREKEQEFKQLVMANFKFVNSLDDPQIPEEAVFVFGKRAPCRMAEELLIKRIKRTYGTDHVSVSLSNDEESSTAGNWRIASVPICRDLSQKLKEKRELYLYEKGRYEFTYNLQGSFQQGQLGILLTFDKDDIGKEALQLFKGPPGCKEFPPLEDFLEERLIALGWRPVKVPFDYSRPVRMWSNIVARRQQYGIRPRVASTIHASMGSTYSKLVTAVSNHPHLYNGIDFTLWDAAQVVVLISRTRGCDDLYFVGSPQDVADQLIAALHNTSRYLPHIRLVLNKLCANPDDEVPILPPPSIFRPCDIILEPVPAVYLLVSTRRYKYMYIGETMDVRKRLNDHNSGQGSRFTNDPTLRPWALYGYIFGFDSRSQRRRFEAWWKRVAQSNIRMRKSGTPPGVLEIGQRLATQINCRLVNNNRRLRVQQCGEMVEMTEEN